MPRAEPPIIQADSIYEIPTCDIIPTSNDTNELKEIKDMDMKDVDKEDNELDKPLLREPDMNRTATSYRDDQEGCCDNCCAGSGNGGDDDLCMICCMCCWICCPNN